MEAIFTPRSIDNKTISYDGDIAVLVASNPFKLSQRIGPVCLDKRPIIGYVSKLNYLYVSKNVFKQLGIELFRSQRDGVMTLIKRNFLITSKMLKFQFNLKDYVTKKWNINITITHCLKTKSASDMPITVIICNGG